MNVDNKKIIGKWLPIIEGSFNYKNSKVNKILCIFAEWHCIKNPEISLIPIFKEIQNKIHNLDIDNKVEIIGEFLNPYSGLIEYKLSNGEFINKGDKIEIEFNTVQILDLFGEDFLRFYSIEDFRDIQLGKINI